MTSNEKCQGIILLDVTKLRSTNALSLFKVAFIQSGVQLCHPAESFKTILSYGQKY